MSLKRCLTKVKVTKMLIQEALMQHRNTYIKPNTTSLAGILHGWSSNIKLPCKQTSEEVCKALAECPEDTTPFKGKKVYFKIGVENISMETVIMTKLGPNLTVIGSRLAVSNLHVYTVGDPLIFSFLIQMEFLSLQIDLIYMKRYNFYKFRTNAIISRK